MLYIILTDPQCQTGVWADGLSWSLPVLTEACHTITDRAQSVYRASSWHRALTETTGNIS